MVNSLLCISSRVEPSNCQRSACSAQCNSTLNSSCCTKLIDRNVPLVVVRIFVHWYRQQTLCVKWGRNTSSFFTVSNDVRQGGILSPFLFTLYIDELSYQLNNSNLGCHINNVCVNNLFYADDLCLMAPSPVGLQHLIDICANYGYENDLLLFFFFFFSFILFPLLCGVDLR